MAGEEPTTEQLILRFQLMVEEIEGLLLQVRPSRNLQLDMPLQLAGLVVSALVGIVVGRL